jgi:cobalt-precorrin 5A hydrolase
VQGTQNPSEVVKKHVGTPGVAEPSALLCAGARELLVPKTVYTETGAGRSMTFAVARVPFAKREVDSGKPSVAPASSRTKEGAHV